MIVQAVGFARRPGRYNVENEIKRKVMRFLVWVLFRRWIPLELRQTMLFRGLKMVREVSLFAGASIGNTFENDLLLLIFNATAIANIADNAASSPLTNLSYALHTADPGEAGNQSTSEIAYTSYARVSVARTSGGHTVTANSVSPAATISFPAGTGGSGTAAYFSVGPTGGGTTKILFSGTVTPNVVCGSGVTPQLTTATAITLD